MIWGIELAHIIIEPIVPNNWKKYARSINSLSFCFKIKNLHETDKHLFMEVYPENKKASVSDNSGDQLFQIPRACLFSTY